MSQIVQMAIAKGNALEETQLYFELVNYHG